MSWTQGVDGLNVAKKTARRLRNSPKKSRASVTSRSTTFKDEPVKAANSSLLCNLQEDIDYIVPELIPSSIEVVI